MKARLHHRPPVSCVPNSTSASPIDALPSIHDQSASQPRLQVLRLHEVCRVTGLCRSMVYRLEAEKKFPCRVRITKRAVGWIDGEVRAWLAERIERHRAGQVG